MWKGVDATLQLAQSSNAKVIVVGSGKTGLPILLGNLDTVITPPATAEGGAANTGSDAKALAPLTNTPEASSSDKPKAGTTATPLPGLPRGEGNGARPDVPPTAMEAAKPPAKPAPATSK
jgi:hypothetical protein